MMAELTAIRAFLAETPGETAYSRVATNGHIPHRNQDAAGEGALALQVMVDDLGDGPNDFQDDPAEEDAGDVSIIEPMSDANPSEPPRAADPSDRHVQADAVEANEDAGDVSAPTPPAFLLSLEHDATALPGTKTEPGESVADMTPRPPPDNPIDPAESSITAAPSVPLKPEGKPPLPGTLKARILDVIEQSARPRRPWQIQKELDLPRLPSAELSRLVARGYIVRVKEGCYGLPGRDYGGATGAEGISP